MGFREWEYLPGGWPSPNDLKIKGWNIESIARVQKDRWAKSVSFTQGSGLPEDPIVHYHYGMAQYANNNPDEAKQSLSKFLTLSPNDPHVPKAKEALAALS